MKKKIFLLLLLFFCITRSLSAASLLVVAPKTAMEGDEVSVDIYLETPSEEVNALEGTLVFDSKVAIKEIRTAQSIVNFWVEKPHTVGSSIVFSGVIPGGFIGKKTKLFSVILAGTTVGDSRAHFAELKAYVNDGKGTETSLKAQPLTMTFVKKTDGHPEALIPTVEDHIAPEAFVPLIGRDSHLLGNQYFVVFSTVDKQTDIDHYEVLETSSPVDPQKEGAWLPAESPYVLKDQARKSYIYVKALDTAGNSTIESITPEHAGYPRGVFVFGGILVVILIILTLMFFGRRKR